METENNVFNKLELENDMTLSFMDEYNILEKPDKDKKLGKILSVLGGVCQMLPQNVVIVTFDYFKSKFPEHNVFFLMLIPLSIGLVIMSLLMLQLQSILKIYQRLQFGAGACAILLPLLPLIANYFPNEFGFWACMTIMLFFGCAMQLILAGGISFTSAFQKDNFTTYFFTGGALSGILSTILLIFLLSIFGTSESSVLKATMIFFFFSSGLFLLVVKLSQKFSQTPFSKRHLCKIEKIEEIEMDDYINTDILSNNGSRLTAEYTHSEISDDDFGSPIMMKVKSLDQSQQKTNTYEFFISVMKQIWPIPVLLAIGQIQTAIMYPGYSISKIELGNAISSSWKTTSMALTFTIGDLIGRMSTTYLPQSESAGNNVIKFRYLLCLAFVILVQSWIPMIFRFLIYLNLFLFAFTNGWQLTLLIIIGGAKANDSQKETCSTIVGIALNIGIVSGMVLALLLV